MSVERMVALLDVKVNEANSMRIQSFVLHCTYRLIAKSSARTIPQAFSKNGTWLLLMRLLALSKPDFTRLSGTRVILHPGGKIPLYRHPCGRRHGISQYANVLLMRESPEHKICRD